MAELRIEFPNLDDVIVNRVANQDLYNHLGKLQADLDRNRYNSEMNEHPQSTRTLNLLIKKIEQIRGHIIDDPNVEFSKKKDTK